MSPQPVVGRLAPTPSGHLHLGNACAFACAWLSARSQGGRLLLRIEDVDTPRAREEVAASQRADLAWLGLDWDEEVPRQSARDYAPWLERLGERLYFCNCTRRQVQEGGGAYPGTCRDAGHREGAVRFRLPEGPVLVRDRLWGDEIVDPARFGDPVLRRRDGVFTYNLAVVADDIADGVTEVVRGADLRAYTAVQTRLWEAFGVAPPTWLHAPLVLGQDGKKLSKSHGSAHIGALRDAGWAPGDVLGIVLPWLGIDGACTLREAVDRFEATAVPRGSITVGGAR